MTPSHTSLGAPLAFDAVAERAGLAARYAEAAAYLAAAQDGPGMAHALGCAGRALLAASEAASTLRRAAQAGSTGGGTMMDLRRAALALGGEVVGRGIVCPGPGHSRQDRSLSILFDASAPGGFTLHSHAGDDFGACRDYVRERLGLSVQLAPKPNEAISRLLVRKTSDSTALALRIWREAREPVETPVARYLARRGLETVYDVHDCLRFHPNCPFAGSRTPAMVALVRNVVTNQPQAIHRSALMSDGRKIEVNGKDRLALGSIRGGAVKLTPDEEVTTCLGIGEGIETTLSLHRLPEFGASPVWSVLNAGGITSFPVLSGIEVLWIAVDDDPAGRGASELCADRWRRAGREVFLVRSTTAGADLNDIPEVRHG